MSIDLLNLVLRVALDFLKQNWVKNKRRTRLNLDTLDAFIRVSLTWFGVHFMDWIGFFESWITTTRTNKRRACIVTGVHSWLGYYFWDKLIKDFVALDLNVYYDLTLLNL